MFVVHIHFNGEESNFYFRKLKNARLFERKILTIIYNNIEQNKANRNLYFYIKNVEEINLDFDYNCNILSLTKGILRHESNENIYDLETYVELISTLD